MKTLERIALVLMTAGFAVLFVAFGVRCRRMYVRLRETLPACLQAQAEIYYDFEFEYQGRRCRFTPAVQPADVTASDVLAQAFGDWQHEYTPVRVELYCDADKGPLQGMVLTVRHGWHPDGEEYRFDVMPWIWRTDTGERPYEPFFRAVTEVLTAREPSPPELGPVTRAVWEEQRPGESEDATFLVQVIELERAGTDAQGSETGYVCRVERRFLQRHHVSTPDGVTVFLEEAAS